MEKHTLEDFCSMIFETLTNLPYTESNLIRRHTCKLEELGEISFPIKLKNWSQFINGASPEDKTIFCNKLMEDDEEKGLEKLLQQVKHDVIRVVKHKIKNNAAHLFFERTSLFKAIIPQVLDKKEVYGYTELFSTKITSNHIENFNTESCSNFTALRISKIKNVTEKLVKMTSNKDPISSKIVYLSTQPQEDKVTVVCGSVVNESGVKDTSHTSDVLYSKRIGDVRKMFEHKYGKSSQNPKLQEYFERLGKAYVTLELLANHPHKVLKVDLNKDAKTGFLFVFYNCARISTLFKEYERKVCKKLYPEMLKPKDVDFSLLKEPEEWKLFYVYILQYPLVIKSCIKDIETGCVNPHHLVTFLCSLSSVFSVYYRRVRILIDPREHLIPVIQARMSLLRALQIVFYNALDIFDIEPVTEM